MCLLSLIYYLIREVLPDAGLCCLDVSFESSILFDLGSVTLMSESVALMSMTFLFFAESNQLHGCNQSFI